MANTTRGRHSGPGRPTQFTPDEEQSEPTAVDEADEEDGRDIWDKALDWAPTIGMFAGATAGGRWGAKAGTKAWKKVDSLEAKIAKLEAKGRDPHVGLSQKEAIEYRKAQADLKYALGKAGENLAGRMLLKAPGGAIAGRVAGGAIQDTFQQKKRKMRAGE